MLDLSFLSESQIEKILGFYSKFKKSNNDNYITEIDNILRLEFSISKSHTHLQFATAKATQKIAKEYTYTK